MILVQVGREHGGDFIIELRKINIWHRWHNFPSLFIISDLLKCGKMLFINPFFCNSTYESPFLSKLSLGLVVENLNPSNLNVKWSVQWPVSCSVLLYTLVQSILGAVLFSCSLILRQNRVIAVTNILFSAHYIQKGWHIIHTIPNFKDLSQSLCQQLYYILRIIKHFDNNCYFIGKL